MPRTNVRTWPALTDTPVGRLADRAVAVAATHGTRLPSALAWDRGRGWVPSPRAKRRHLAELLAARGHRVFVEAGTYRGDTVKFMLPHAERIVSVELDQRLYDRARRRFASTPSVDIRFGDAADIVPEVVAAESSPALLFLDGHYSGPGTAEGEEVEPAEQILERLGRVAPPGTTIVVDDLRLFGADPLFPDLAELTSASRIAFPRARHRLGLDSLVIEL